MLVKLSRLQIAFVLTALENTETAVARTNPRLARQYQIYRRDIARQTGTPLELYA